MVIIRVIYIYVYIYIAYVYAQMWDHNVLLYRSVGSLSRVFVSEKYFRNLGYLEMHGRGVFFYAFLCVLN